METHTSIKVEPYYNYNPRPNHCATSSSRFSNKPPQSQLHHYKQNEINHYRQENLPFDFEMPIRFASCPLQAQAYLHYNRHHITSFFTQFTSTLKNEIVKQIEHYESQTVAFLNRLFSCEKYSDIACNNHLRSSLLNNSKILTTSIPKLEDYHLPSFKSMKRLMLTIRQHLDQFIDLKTVQSNVNIEKEKDNNTNNDNNVVVKKEHDPECSKIEIGELKHYVHEFHTLSTATSLMGDKLDSFYSYDPIAKQTALKCRHCDFQKTIFSQQKSFSKTQGSKIILDHLLMDHPFIANYNYDHIVTRRAVREIKLPEIAQMANALHIQRVYIVDRSCSLYFCHAIKNSEPSVAVQMLYFGESSHSNCEFVRGGNSKEVLLLLGLLIQQIVSLGKKVTVYTNESKCSIIEDFCKYYSIEGVNTVAGKGRRQTRGELNPNKMEEGPEKEEPSPKLQYIFPSGSERLPRASRRGYLKIQEETDC